MGRRTQATLDYRFLNAVGMNESRAPSKSRCSEPWVVGKCHCDKVSFSAKSYQCSGCLDLRKWGYGCELDCPTDCALGCDFSGNCIVKRACPPNCKRNSRDGENSDKTKCVNSRNECEACQDGFHGLFCEKPCPEKCGASYEGKCTRKGTCYNCLEGFFGDHCDQKCPEACPKCVMRDNIIPDEDNKGKFLKAGVCSEPCRKDTWGHQCEKSCPANCVKGKGASCSRDAGACKACVNRTHYGLQCKEQCSRGCVGGKCDISGRCLKGCDAGAWGNRCDRACPEYSVQCDRSTGKPFACSIGFPGFDSQGVPACLPCPAGCASDKCAIDGKCVGSCTQGLFGPWCDQQCQASCIGPCDKANGECESCHPGFTGAKCQDRCDSTCAECKQFTGNGRTKKPGNLKTDCLECKKDAPAELRGGACVCIEGAIPAPAEAEHHCMCKPALEEKKEATLSSQPNKVCGFRCRRSYGKYSLKPIYSVNDPEAPELCISGRMQKLIIRADGNLTQGQCAEGELFIPNLGTGEEPCLKKGYVDYLNGD